jgi:anaerobic selenocysteine-containing dehydrogenase
MSWKKTSCALCPINCGLEVQIENNRIVKARPDKDNPRSEGYACRKGLNIAFHQHNADRLSYPLKRVGNKFERVSWDQAIREIAEKLRSILDEHGPRSLAWMISGVGCQFGIPYLVRLGTMLGSKYNYSALGQEHTGRYWAHGLTLGSQGLLFRADMKHADMLMAVGWNPLMSHQTPQARRKLTKMAKDPDRLLVVVDPRVSETAKIADIHLPLRPGTDALLFKSMIAMILKEGMQDQEYIDRHVNGLKEVWPWFADFDVKAALRVCELDYDQVYEVCREFASKKSCLHDDLGILMGRHSTLVSYLLVVLLAVCGRICTPGGNYFPCRLIGKPPHSDPNDPDTWRTVVTDIPAIQGMFPPNVMPEEIMNEHPDRLRAVLVYGANPLRSYADTTAYENAFGQLDLLVTTEIVMSETAALSHYVLPSRSAYEAHDGVFFNFHFPEVFFQMRRPVVEPEGEQLEAGEIFTRMADAMGLIPALPESLFQAAESGCGKEYRDALTGYVKENPESKGALPFIVVKTLGKALGSAHLAGLCALLQKRSRTQMEEAARAGFTLGPDQCLEMCQAILDHPEGILVGVGDPETKFSEIETRDGKIQLYVPDFEEWMNEINPADEEERLKTDDQFPLILMAGRHMDMNANTNMRDPAWNKGRRACTLAMNPADAESLGFEDGQMVRVTTEAGKETIEVEVTEAAKKGQVIIPHGFGLVYDGVKYGANVNRLTKNTHRDRIAATPLHRYVPCRVEVV